jgi:hypothetical protein
VNACLQFLTSHGIEKEKVCAPYSIVQCIVMLSYRFTYFLTG